MAETLTRDYVAADRILHYLENNGSGYRSREVIAEIVAESREEADAALIQVRDLVMTGSACPSQWEGTSDRGRIYIRFRNGGLSASVDGEEVYGEYQRGDGRMSTEDMQRHLQHIFKFA